MINSLLRTLALISITAFSHAQTISGKVLDSNTSEPLPFANVFLNNTTIGTVTGPNGEFTFKLITEPGIYELVFSFVGYEPYKTKVTVGEGNLTMGSIKLVPSEIQLSDVEVKGTRDKEWEKKFRKFKKVFLGEDKKAAACTIQNPWVVDFPAEESGNKFIAKASAPIEINNESLGYKVIFYMNSFWYDGTAYSITGNARFSELKSMDAKVIAGWETNRKNAYQHSTHHLFKSIIDHRINGEGFNLYTETDAYKNASSRSALFYSELGQTVIPYDTSSLVVPDKQEGYYRISLKGRVEIHYRKEKALIRVYRDVFGPVSWIRLNKNYVVVSKDGFAKNPADVVVSGDMSNSRVASMLPLDYKPLSATNELERITYSMYMEQIYVHTDKPYYYPGETIWFKGYVNYATPAWRDSLSRTVHVELIDKSTKSVVRNATLEVLNGFFDNGFRLPDSLAAKMYYLRAYTNFNRNFGDEHVMVKPLPILNLYDKVNPYNYSATKNDSEGPLAITSDKTVYNPREKITLTLKLKDDEDKPVAGNLSISVVDSSQVVPLKISGTILEEYPIKEIDEKQFKKDQPFPVEYGINFSGRFLNENNKPEKAALNVFRLNPNQFTMAQSDEEGMFSVGGLTFYDTANFSIQATRGKGESYGRGEWIPNQPASMDFKECDFKMDISNAGSPQRILSDYEAPKGTRVLQEVEIKSTRIAEEYKVGYREARPYGKPDYVIKKKDINPNYGNLLLILPGKVPGLNVQQVNNPGEPPRWVVYTERGGRNGSIQNPKEAIITVNDVIVGGTPEQILSAINPAMVESIEIKTGINVLYGSLGGNGIVAIYTKKDFEKPEETKSVSMMKVPGYVRPKAFKAPDYNDPKTDTTQSDYRSTIYWNPQVILDSKTGASTISFFAADLPGQYRIEVEGVTQTGEPVRYTHSLRIEN